jgi:hypothetical protein
MVKRFRIPPPPQHFTREIAIGLDSDDLDGPRQFFHETGLVPLYEYVCERWLPFVRKQLSKATDVQNPETDESAELDVRREELLYEVCPTLVFLYLGRRLGRFQATIVSESKGTGDKYEYDGSKAGMSYALTELAAVLGERQAGEIFRRLERETDVLLGRKRG